MRILQRGRIPRDSDYFRFPSNAFPCIEVLPSGRWLASFRIAEKKEFPYFDAVMTYSDDEGQTWVPWYKPVVLPEIDGRNGMCLFYYVRSLGRKRVLMVCNWVDGSIPQQPFYDPETESLKDSYIFSSISEDEGITWSKPQRVDTGSMTEPAALTGAPLLLGNGDVVCQFEINKNRNDPGKWIHRSAMVFSSDQGRSWSDLTLVTHKEDMYYWDQRPCVLHDGRTIVDFFWTLDGKKNQYLTIHGRESLDGGRTWGDIWDTGIYGQPGSPADCGGVGLACIDIDRSISPVITVRLSSDRGRSFYDSLVVYDSTLARQDSRNISMNEAWAEMAKFSVGHPNLMNLSENRLLAYWYAGDHFDDTNIEFAVIGLEKKGVES